MPEIKALPDRSFLAKWPLYRFSISRLYGCLARRVAADIISPIGDKLIDIKLHFAYLLTIEQHFYRGATLIVGNNELGKLNSNTISLLRAIHYRVYLLAILTEQILDLLWFVFDGRTANLKRGKWDKIIERLQSETGYAILMNADAALLRSFNEKYRTAELHKFSMVGALTGKDKWSHLQEEEQAVTRLIDRAYAYFTQA